MQNLGFITLHRKITEWEWYQDTNTFRLFIHILLNANHTEKKWQGHLINRGEFLTGRKSLSSSTGLTEQQIRTSLSKLKSTNEITIKTTSRNSVITVIKYDDYQQNNQQATSKQPASNQQSTTTNNVNNDNNVNNKKRTNKESFKKPSFEDIKKYCLDKNKSIDIESFINHYESNGWFVGKNKMKSWTATVNQWHSRNIKKLKSKKAVTKNLFPSSNDFIDGECDVIK